MKDKNKNYIISLSRAIKRYCKSYVNIKILDPEGKDIFVRDEVMSLDNLKLEEISEDLKLIILKKIRDGMREKQN